MDPDRVRRFYTVLSHINRLLVRVRDPLRLAQEVCRVAVHDGHFVLAWVGKYNPATSKLGVFAFDGVGAEFLTTDMDLAETSRSRGPTGRAVLAGEHMVCNDIEAEASMEPWRAEARRLGIRSSGAFPVFSGPAVWGVLNLYSDETGFFDTDEIRLLDELAMDLGFSLEVSSKENQLLQSQKLESLGTLASGIAHDFNNILGIILTQSELLELPVSGDRKTAALGAVKNAARRGAALVRQLLTFARKSEPRMVGVSLNELAAEVVKLLEETLPRNIRLIFDPSADLPPTLADATQVHQVLLNLCLNARDAMPSGGTLTLSTADDPRPCGPRLVLRVADTGTGMDEATLRQIFVPFFTTKEPGKGTGLGLAMVFGIMETHHGSVTVESTPGVGTTFECRFPVLGKECRDP